MPAELRSPCSAPRPPRTRSTCYLAPTACHLAVDLVGARVDLVLYVLLREIGQEQQLVTDIHTLIRTTRVSQQEKKATLPSNGTIDL